LGFAIKEKALQLESLAVSSWERYRESGSAFSEAAERQPFNIGRIPVKQSRQGVLLTGHGKSCRRAQKGAPELRRRRSCTPITI
jgi:hypothetical protein